MLATQILEGVALSGESKESITQVITSVIKSFFKTKKLNLLQSFS